MAERWLNETEAREFNETLKRIKVESPRAAAVLTGAELDYWLKTMLEAYLLPHEGNTPDALFQGGALGTFSARIDVAYRLGLIERPLHQQLHLVRKIRNEFAHARAGHSFEDTPVCDYCRALGPAAERPDTGPIENLTVEHRSCREQFEVSATMLTLMLTGMATRTERVRGKLAPE